MLVDFSDSVGSIFCKPNIDPGGRKLSTLVDSSVNETNNRFFRANFGPSLYLSTLRAVNAGVGNSSSGLGEASSLGAPSMNIGKRQDGRVHEPSVINCAGQTAEIDTAFELAGKMDKNVFLPNVSDIHSL